MTKFYVHPSTLHQATLTIPPSKSHTLRSILFGMMGKGTSTIRNYLTSPDSQAMISAAVKLGAQIQVDPHQLKIKGVGAQLQSAEDVIDAGNSGQVLRFIGALSSLSPTFTVISGDRSIRYKRPIKTMLDALKQLGAFAESSRQDGFAPIIVKGPIKPGSVKLCGVDSQPVSALLMATSFLDGISHIEVSDPGEKPWIDLTLHWLEKMGIRVENNNYQHYTVYGQPGFDAFDVEIPGDFSTAAFPLVAALITGAPVVLKNLDMQDVQGDKKIIHTLLQMGAKIEVDPHQKQVMARPSGMLQGMRIDVNDHIDSIAILAVLGCFAKGTTEIFNAKAARGKESDRIHVMAEELKKMGADVEEKEDGIVVRASALKGAALNSHHDHRVAMALTIAALNAEGASTIDHVECVEKSYPDFIRDFWLMGAKIEMKP